jgi:hypothetical protein
VNAAGLADRITEAASAETEPRNRVQQLTAALDSAVAAQKYADAETLRDELDEARGTLAFAEATTSALRQAEQATEAQRAADSLRIQLAQAKDAATAVIDSAAIAEKRSRRRSGRSGQRWPGRARRTRSGCARSMPA